MSAIAFQSRFSDGTVFDEQNIEQLELDRCQRALRFIKAKIRPDIRHFLRDELAETTARAEDYVARSGGRWKSGAVDIVMPGIGFRQYHDWFMGKIEARDEIALQVAHPDHYLNLPDPKRPAFVEIIENLGSDDLPWYIEGEFVAAEELPLARTPGYPEAMSLKIRTENGVVAGYAGHEFKDDAAGNCCIKLSIILPEAAPDALIIGHLKHFSIEFHNWYLAARRELAG